MSWPGGPPPHTPPRTPAAPHAWPGGPQPLGARTASAAPLLPSRSPEAHRRMLQRAHSVQPGRAGGGSGSQGASPAGSFQAARDDDDDNDNDNDDRYGGGGGGYHFSPRRKRVLGESAASPRRLRRRLFFADASDERAAPEDRERRRRAACSAALAVIREAVEVGDPHVDLSDLDLDAVPDELAELKDLVVLAPSSALVTDLQLTLGSNALRQFPLAVCELTNLTTLILSHNRIAHLPPEIGNLANLRELSVAHNCLRCLPLELARLARLHTLTVFPNPFLLPPPAPAPADSPEAALGRRLALRGPARPFRLALHRGGLPRLADLAARRLSRAELAALKHRLAQCVGAAPLPLGRIVGLAADPASTTGGAVAALAAQHLALPAGHLCACCARWFLMPPAELTVWAPLSLLPRPAPFVVRLCGRACLHAPAVARLLDATIAQS
ncbi:hypothetical protein H4R18_003219 [Coemansia javaensis]|uniref:Uncharacterized protein n=1 Tax=Coemansia javaensis TaxID=2761396 RepID=A0A9W8LI12_9FUNG|nr:hypothetical protein H4R18_003219 [Coemansia javaensis]